MNGGIGCAVALDVQSKAVLLKSLTALMRGNATFFEMSDDVQKNVMWLADILARDVAVAITAIS